MHFFMVKGKRFRRKIFLEKCINIFIGRSFDINAPVIVIEYPPMASCVKRLVCPLHVTDFIFCIQITGKAFFRMVVKFTDENSGIPLRIFL